MTVSVTKGES